MSKIKWKGGALLSPVPPAMISCSNGEEDNIITIAWCGMLATNPPTTYISVRPTRHSYEMIKKSDYVRTDLASERELGSAKANAVKEDFEGISLTVMNVDSDETSKLLKKQKIYLPITIELQRKQLKK